MEQEIKDFILIKELKEFREKERLNPLLNNIFKGKQFKAQESLSEAVIKVNNMMFVFDARRPLEVRIRPEKTCQTVGNTTLAKMDPFKIQLVRNILSYRGNHKKYAKILAEDILEYKKRKKYEKKHDNEYPANEDGKYEREISIRKIILMHTLRLHDEKIETLRVNLMNEYDDVYLKNRELEKNRESLSKYITEIEKDLSREAIQKFYAYCTDSGYNIEFEKTKDNLFNNQLHGLLSKQPVNQLQRVISLFLG